MFSLIVVSCSIGSSAPQSPSVDEIVTATLAALTAQAEQAPTPMIGIGSISGTLSYPADRMPAVRVAIFNLKTGQPVFFDTLPDQTTFQVDELPVSDYQVVAYTLGDESFPSGIAGGYTQYIVCGAGESCTDHSLATVAVTSGQVTSVHVGDWILPEGTYPPMPGPQVVTDPNNNPDAGPPILQLGGAISGNLSYPSSFIPSLAVVAFRVGGSPTDYYYTITNQGDTTYTITDMSDGEYYVVAYSLENPSLAGGYTQAVPCGLSIDCSDHSLILVPVANGGATGDVNPGDWYAPAGTFPAYPLP